MFIKCKVKALERQTENSLFGNEIWEKEAQGSFTFYYTHSDLFQLFARSTRFIVYLQ